MLKPRSLLAVFIDRKRTFNDVRSSKNLKEEEKEKKKKRSRQFAVGNSLNPWTGRMSWALFPAPGEKEVKKKLLLLLFV